MLNIALTWCPERGAVPAVFYPNAHDFKQILRITSKFSEVKDRAVFLKNLFPRQPENPIYRKFILINDQYSYLLLFSLARAAHQW